MKLSLAAIFFIVAAASLLAQDRGNLHVVESDPLSPREQLKKFHVPPGFEVQLVAAEPDVQKPINLAFDQRGRLYATQSVEYPYPPPVDKTGRDAVKLLTDFDSAGRAKRISTFVGGLSIPIGIVPLSDGAIVYSIPNLYRCWDSDGDGRCERREVLYREFGYRDTHGMCNNLRRWIDGWIYACHGFSNTSTLAGDDKHAITMQSGNTFRMRQDGSHVEQFTQGQVNPFGLAFDPLGNLYSADCHSRPLYMLLRGACYPSFGKPHDGLGFGPEICRHSHGSTGIAGVVYYAADHFPAEFRDTIFIGNPITNRINHDRLEQHGSTFKAVELPDFLTCDDRWFRPVDVCLGPDGALYIADFYNRIIGHYEVPLNHPGRDRERGRIWRVVYKGTAEHPFPAPQMPNLAKLPLGDLLKTLDSENLTVRTMAVNELVDRFPPEQLIPPLRRAVTGEGTPAQRAFGLWVLARRGALDKELAARLAGDSAAIVRIHLLHALAEHLQSDGGEPAVVEILRGRLADANPVVRRAAADALGRYPSGDNIPHLLKVWSNADPSDSQLIHTARMALRDQLLDSGVLSRLATQTEMDSGDAARLAEAGLGVKSEESASFVLAWLLAAESNRPRLAEYLHHATRYLPPNRLPELYANFDRRAAWHRSDCIRALSQAAQERGSQRPRSVELAAIELTRKLLANKQEPRVKEALELARDLRLSDLHADLARQLKGDARFPNLRPLALEACAACDATATIALAANLLTNSQVEFSLRQKAAQVLATLSADAAREALVATLRTAPERLAVEVAAGLASTPAGADRLLTAMSEGQASPQLLLEPAVAIRLEVSKPPRLAERRAKLTAGLPPRDERLRQMISARRDGFQRFTFDLATGEKVFAKNCAACHKLGEQGKKIGPELDGIALRGIDRLLEDVLDPSRNVDQAFRSTAIVTADGRALTGLVLREEGQVLVLADAQGKEIRLPASEIEQRGVSPLSPMPANVIDIISEPDFYHLLGFLLEQRKKPK